MIEMLGIWYLTFILCEIRMYIISKKIWKREQKLLVLSWISPCATERHLLPGGYQCVEEWTGKREGGIGNGRIKMLFLWLFNLFPLWYQKIPWSNNMIQKKYMRMALSFSSSYTLSSHGTTTLPNINMYMYTPTYTQPYHTPN